MLTRWIAQFKKEGIWLEGDATGEVDLFTADSRSIQASENRTKKTVFFARKGVVSDGHDFLKHLSTASNLVALVAEHRPEGFQSSIPLILVRDSVAAMSIAAKDFYQDPTQETFSVAVTGTNGKTTTTFLLQSLLKQIGRKPARMGTIDTEFEGLRIPSRLTTPDFSETQKIFSELHKSGASAFCFEASSHALDQRRLLGLELDAAIFTNLTPEHLDYHRTMENYYKAKRKLFFELLARSVKKIKYAIVRDDGSYGSRLLLELESLTDVKTLGWGFECKSSATRLRVESCRSDLSGSELVVSGLNFKREKFRSRLVGLYNVENMMGAIALGALMQMEASKIQKAFDELPPVSGRLEKVESKKGAVFVDYAHTPDALENVLSTLRPLTKGRLKVVFGCGGDRDRMKRPQMGAIAELYADELYVTSDNPRTEDPELIIQEILQGIQRLKPTIVEVDRRKAIEKSLQNLGEHDVVLIAGKGHETYQILGTQRIEFDDRLVAKEALALS